MALNSGTEPMTAEATLCGVWQPRITAAAPNDSLATAAVKGWSDVCDTLLKWRANPLVLEDDGIDAPSSELIESALAFSSFFGLREKDPIPAPTSVGPTPEGGISFEWRRGADLEIAEIAEVGKAEYTGIQGDAVGFNVLLRQTLDGQWVLKER